MCGFVSMLTDKSFDKHDINKIHEMVSLSKHRGPDHQDVYMDQHVCFGFDRLSIIDLEKGEQPFSYDDGRYTMVFNGEIYNYIELREMLTSKGITFTTESDTEVIIALYKVVGKDVVHHLRGMFSFLIWDRENELLFGARDPFGIKPFYYCEADGNLYCASEQKALMLTNDKSWEINMESLHHYLTFQYVPEPETIINNIVRLEPGHIIQKKVGEGTRTYQYWSVKFNPVKKSKEKKLAAIREVLKESVAVHMRSDVPVGLFLSGGIDSTIVASLAAKINPHIKSFTVGFEQEGFSEIEHVKETAAELNLENISRIITHEEFVKELPKIIWHMDGPVADPAAVPLYFVAQEARKHVKVVLSGEGADELFGGYNIYREPDSLRVFSYIPNIVKALIKKTSNLIPEGIRGKSFLHRGCTPIEERYVGNAYIFGQDEKMSLLYNFNKEFVPASVLKPIYEEVKNRDCVTKMQHIDIYTWLRGDILVKADKMTMAHSLEARMPFLDKEVFNIASQLTLDEKIRQGTTKYALREAFKGIIPHSALNRKKLGFPVPIRHWLRNELYLWAENLILLSDTDRLINKDKVLEMLKKHRQGTMDYGRKIWTILVFMLWHQVFVEKLYSFDQEIESGVSDWIH